MIKNTTSTLRRAILAACLVATTVPAGFAVGTDGSAFAQSRGGGGGGAKGAGGRGGDGGLSEPMAFIRGQNCTAGATCQPKPKPKPVYAQSCSGERVLVSNRDWHCRETF